MKCIDDVRLQTFGDGNPRALTSGSGAHVKGVPVMGF